MSNSKHIDKICIVVIIVTLVITALFMTGEKFGLTVIHQEEDENSSGIFTNNDLNADWDTEGATKIILKDNEAEISGNGAYYSQNTLHIVYAGKYILSGTLDGSVQIDADGDDKIWILFDGVKISSETDAPLYIEQAEKVFLTIKENSENTLTFNNSDEETDIDGAIFSRDDLTINGNGKLTVTSDSLHGIVCNDSLAITGGNINITAKKDAVHAHDAIRICDSDITISAGDDGLHAGNEDETSAFYLKSGTINITDCYEGIEANDITIAGGSVNIVPSDDGLNASGNNGKSLITISGGDISIVNENGRDADGIDSNGSININGGNIFVSVVGDGTNNAIDYGSENGGKCTISGGTVIACGSGQMAEGPSEDSKQGFIMQSVNGNANETVSLINESGKEIITKEIPCSFTSVLVSSPDIAVGDTVTLKAGDTSTEITVDNTSSAASFGGKMMKGKGFNRVENDTNQNTDDGGFKEMVPQNGDENGAPPEMPNDGNNGTKPERPDKGMNGETPPDFNSGDFGSREAPTGEMQPPDTNDDESQKRFDKNDENREMQKNKTEEKSEESTTSIDLITWIWIGVSVLLLIVGIIVVIKKKY